MLSYRPCSHKLLQHLFTVFNCKLYVFKLGRSWLSLSLFAGQKNPDHYAEEEEEKEEEEEEEKKNSGGFLIKCPVKLLSIITGTTFKKSTFVPLMVVPFPIFK